MTDELIVEVLPGKGGDLGHLILNRPRALNALTYAMCQGLQQALQQFATDPTIKGVIIEGAGDKAFCAGGDVRSVYALRSQPEQVMTFFQQEYAMNQTLQAFPKPYIAWLDGITMGGGVGVSIYGSHRIATEHFSFAMPETLIGFFPDIGAGYFLNQCPHFVGYYLGLVGATIRAADAYALGLITHNVPRESRQHVIADLCATPLGKTPVKAVDKVLARFATPLESPPLAPHYASIAASFSQPTVPEVLLTLEAVDTAWSREVIDQLQQRSPTSLVVSLAHLQQCRGLPFAAVMELNLQLASAFIRGHDFFEGVRAVLIDKDQAPQWMPDELPKLKELTHYF